MENTIGACCNYCGCWIPAPESAFAHIPAYEDTLEWQEKYADLEDAAIERVFSQHEELCSA